MLRAPKWVLFFYEFVNEMAESQENYIKVSRSKFFGILLSAIIGSAVVTSFTVINTLNADHFTLIALADRVGSLEQTCVPRTEVALMLESINRRLGVIEDEIIRNRNIR